MSGRLPDAPPQVPRADAGQLYRVQSHPGQGSARHDGADRGGLSSPALPMRRDTRSRLQKIATEVGLIAKPAGPAPESAEFYIYENWAAGPHKIVLHRGSCGQCSHGKGRPSGHDVKPRPLARPLCDSCGGTRNRSCHDRHPDPQRVQVRVIVKCPIRRKNPVILSG